MNISVAPRPQSTPPPMPRTEEMYRQMDRLQGQPPPPMWRQITGAVLSASPRLRGVSALVSGEAGRQRELQKMPLYQAAANEEQEQALRQQQGAIAQQRADTDERVGQSTINRNRAQQTRAETPDPLQYDTSKDLLIPDATDPTGFRTARTGTPQERLHNVAPGTTVLGKDNKPVYTSPAADKPSKTEDLNETIAAKTKIADQNGLKGAERQHFIYGTPMPSQAAGTVADSGMSTRQITTFNQIVDKYNRSPLIQSADKMQGYMKTIENAASGTPDAQKDLALIYSYIKALDYGESTAREGELQLAINTGTLRQQLEAQANRLLTGKGMLSQQQRVNFLNGAKELIGAVNSAAAQKEKAFAAQAETSGVGNAWRSYRGAFQPLYDAGNAQPQPQQRPQAKDAKGNIVEWDGKSWVPKTK